MCNVLLYVMYIFVSVSVCLYLAILVYMFTCTGGCLYDVITQTSTCACVWCGAYKYLDGTFVIASSPEVITKVGLSVTLTGYDVMFVCRCVFIVCTYCFSFPRELYAWLDNCEQNGVEIDPDFATGVRLGIGCFNVVSVG